jgi:hypothetical protein
MLKNITSKEYFNKYSSIIKGISKENLLNLVESLYKDKQDLKNKFLEDKHLNNINMSKIDSKFHRVINLCYKNKTSWSLSDGCSTIKHILRYIVLEVKPIFEEDINNFDKIRKEWLNESNFYKKYPNEDDFYRFRKII